MVADIVLVVDTSGSVLNRRPSQSVSSENFDYLVSFLANFVSQFHISQDMARFGLVTFSESAMNRFYLDTFSTETRLVTSIFGLEHEGGFTNISGALRTAHKEQFVESRGDRSNAPNFAIVITYNTGSVDTDKTSQYAQEIEAFGVKTFSIGITDSVTEGELSLISSRPKKKYYNYFMVPDFSHLEGAEANIVKQIEWYREYGNVIFYSYFTFDQ